MRIGIVATYSPAGGSIAQLRIFSEYLAQENEIVIFTKKKTAHIFENIYHNVNTKIIFSRLSESSLIGRIFWEQVLLPLILRKYKIDVLLCLGNIAPIFSPVVTVQWIGTIGPFCSGFYQHYKLLEKLRLYIIKLFIIMSAHNSDAVIFESNYTKQLFIDKYGIARNRSHVIHIGKSEYFYPIETLEKTTLSDRYGLLSPHILCVSHLYPYKNLIRMLHAFSEALASTNSNNKLLVAGSVVSDKYYNELNDIILKLNIKDSVVFLGSVSKEDLRYLYSKCEFLIFPSPYENFAYTLVEAMCCGSAITCSNTTAMPETCQDAALYFNPDKTKEIAACMITMMKDLTLRKTLSENALQRVKSLPTYEEVTEKTLKIMKDLISSG
jgi:glycosyltransferase involved in cell wall biosynthesis